MIECQMKGLIGLVKNLLDARTFWVLPIERLLILLLRPSTMNLFLGYSLIVATHIIGSKYGLMYACSWMNWLIAAYLCLKQRPPFCLDEKEHIDYDDCLPCSVDWNIRSEGWYKQIYVRWGIVHRSIDAHVCPCRKVELCYFSLECCIRLFHCLSVGSFDKTIPQYAHLQRCRMEPEWNVKYRLECWSAHRCISAPLLPESSFWC